ncbi:MAG: CYTH domain-containing protein [Cyanobacteriota bacterium]|nr:CYTH domain-containing protein [Cyanobacteriota bacterium]
MALEIERRFLVTAAGWRAHVRWNAELLQGYLLHREDGVTIRVRVRRPAQGDPAAWLTIKALADSEAPDQVRQEFEYLIPVEDALALLKLAPWQVSKTRYGLHLPGGDWVLDVFSGLNAPLMMAEVELQHPDDTPPIPSWCTKEVTGMHQLSNAALAEHPWQTWSTEDRESLLPQE